MGENTRNKDDEIEIDLLELLGLIWHNCVLVVSVGLLCALLAFGISKLFIAPYYDSTTKIYILNKNETNTVTYSDTQLATQLTKDYAQLITSRYVLEQVIHEQALDLDYDELLDKVTVSTPTDTRIVAITVRDEDPVLAMNVCNCICSVASEHIRNVMDIDAVNIVETANMPDEKAGPSNAKAAAIAGLLGIVAVCAVLIIRHLSDDTIKTSADVEKYLELSTLALIPLEEDMEDSAGAKNKKFKDRKRKKKDAEG